VSLVAQSLERSHGRDRDGRGLLMADVGRFERHRPPFAHRDILGERSESAAEDFITRLESRDALADRLDRAGKVDAEARVLGCPESAIDAHDVRGPFEVVPVERIDRRGVHADEELVVLRRGLGNVLQTDDVG